MLQVATENIYPDIPSSPLSDVPSDFDNESGAEGPLPTKINPDVEPRPKDAVAGKQLLIVGYNKHSALVM